mgnify:CR=1 FL=1
MPIFIEKDQKNESLKPGLIHHYCRSMQQGVPNIKGGTAQTSL